MRRNVPLQLTALFFVAFNLRIAMACVGPVIDHLRADLQMSRGQLGLLSTLPVLCMSVFAPFAQRVSAARGHETAILFATLLIALSALVRSVAGVSIMLISAFFAGVGIAIAGTLLNTFVKQYFAERSVMVSGLYSAALCLGAALAAAFTAPLTEIVHGSWRLALAAWCVPGFIGAALWWWMLKVNPPVETLKNRSTQLVRLPWSNAKAWTVTAFFGSQSITFYVVLAWLAPLYIELGWSPEKAGALLGYWVAVQVVAVLLIARVASRSRDRRPWLIVCSVAAIVALTGLVVAPLSLPWVWIGLFGVASGGWFPLAMNLPLDYSQTPGEAGSWTAMMLFGGYLISSTSPSVAGWARDAGASYTAIFGAMAALSTLVLILSFFLGPRRQ